MTSNQSIQTPDSDQLPEVDLAALTHAQFAACIGETFRFHGPQNRVFELELTSAELLSSATSPSGSHRKREPFTLIFRLADDSYLPQLIYRLEHERLGELSIFLVPIGPEDKRMRMEAVFT